MSIRFAPACAAVLVALLAASTARAESLFLGAPQMAFDINVVNVDVKYTIANKAANIGKFSATGTPTWLGAPGNTITAGTFTVNAFFDMLTGNVRLADPGNLLHVSGTLGGNAQTFFHSTTLTKFGSGTQDTFDLLYTGNTGTVLPGQVIMTRIMGVSIPNFNDPTFVYAGPGANGDVIWDNTPTAGVEKGTANVWAPAPDAAAGGALLLLGFGAHLAIRRRSRLPA